jgi:hypothetical protein
MIQIKLLEPMFKQAKLDTSIFLNTKSDFHSMIYWYNIVCFKSRVK